AICSDSRLPRPRFREVTRHGLEEGQILIGPAEPFPPRELRPRGVAENEGRQGLGAVSLRDLGIMVDVDLEADELARQLHDVRSGPELRLHFLARLAPGRPEVEENGLSALTRELHRLV